uniref:Uncharacterized protein n=1 Tax=Arundo donax TaxID=35708 RepID=A0A0A9BF80_ARUDO
MAVEAARHGLYGAPCRPRSRAATNPSVMPWLDAHRASAEAPAPPRRMPTVPPWPTAPAPRLSAPASMPSESTASRSAPPEPGKAPRPGTAVPHP